MSWLYLLALLISIAGLLVIDYRYKLAFWYNWRRAAIVLGVGIMIFLVWDVAGIATGIFFTGDSTYVTNVLLAPELPIEEFFFLFLLCYTTLISWRWFSK